MIASTFHETQARSPLFDIDVSVIVYPEGDAWIAQGLEYDITAQASSIPEAYERFSSKVAAEVSISLDLARRPLEGLGRAPDRFWKMYRESNYALNAVSELPAAVAVANEAVGPRVHPRMKIANTVGA